jgi:hypothetical protein
VTPLAQSPRHSNFLKGRPGHSGQQGAVFHPDLRSLRHFYRIPSHSVTVVGTVDQYAANALLAHFRRKVILTGRHMRPSKRRRDRVRLGKSESSLDGRSEIQPPQ